MGQVSKAWVMFTDRSVFTWLRSVPRWALCAAGRLGTATDSATQGRALFVCEPPYFCSARAAWRRESAGTWDARRVNLRNTRQRLRMCLDMTGVGVGWGGVYTESWLFFDASPSTRSLHHFCPLFPRFPFLSEYWMYLCSWVHQSLWVKMNDNLFWQKVYLYSQENCHSLCLHNT